MGGSWNYQLFHDDDKTKKNENVAASPVDIIAWSIYFSLLPLFLLDFSTPTSKAISIAEPPQFSVTKDAFPHWLQLFCPEKKNSKERSLITWPGVLNIEHHLTN